MFEPLENLEPGLFRDGGDEQDRGQAAGDPVDDFYPVVTTGSRPITGSGFKPADAA